MATRESTIYGQNADAFHNESAEVDRGALAQAAIDRNLEAIKRGEVEGLLTSIQEALTVARKEDSGTENMNAVAIELIGRINLLEAPMELKQAALDKVEEECRGLLHVT